MADGGARPSTELDPELIPIGEFARRTRLSQKALRIYAAGGLLVPAQTDPWNGYRRYSPEQVPLGRLVGLLRGADLGLAAIGAVLAAREQGAEQACSLLDRLLADADREHHGRVLVIRHVETILREEQDQMFEIKTRAVPAQRLMSIQRRQTAELTDAFVAEAKTAFARHLNGRQPTGPFTLIFHGPVNEQADGPIEAALPVPHDVQPSELIGIRSEPAHEQAYTTITKRQWAFPAILAAYDAVASSPQAAERARTAPLSCREVYLAEPDQVGDDEPICDVAFPLADRG